MSNYTKLVNYAAKDSLPTGNAAKIVSGAEIDADLSAIAVAVNSKANIAAPTFTGTTTMAGLTATGTVTMTLDGGTY